MTLTVKVISPDQTVLNSTADEVILPSSTGQLGVLTDHAPLITALDAGVIRFRRDRDWATVAVSSGFAEIEDNEVAVLVRSAQLGVDIDAEAARTELTAAEERLAGIKEDDKQGKILAEQDLRLARARLQATTNVWF